jgi:glyoxylase-like metal-dependent hydrolase (beta-lactamase superfamily II)
MTLGQSGRVDVPHGRHTHIGDSTMRVATSLVLLACLLAGLAFKAVAQEQPMRGIVNVTGQLYRAQNGNAYNVFLVTPDGIIMTDPISRDFSRWLKAEFATRYKVPVKYVLYSHSDWDHDSGGVIFADTAEFVGQRNMLAALAPPTGNPALREDMASMDVNHDERIARSEAKGAVAQRFDLLDSNRDDVVSGAELLRGSVNDVYAPTITFSDKYTVTLGGKSVTMVWLGGAHTPDSSAVYFPAERAVFGADIMQVKRIPMDLVPNIGAYIEALRRINALDYEYALPGHAMTGKKADIVDEQHFLEDLARGVAAGVAAGKSLEDVQKTVTLDAYEGYERWPTVVKEHVADVYATLMGGDCSCSRTEPTQVIRELK